jgi:hypothetical protein
MFGAYSQSGRVIEFAGLDAADDGADVGLDEEQRDRSRRGSCAGWKVGRCRGGSSQRTDLPLMSHRNAPLSFEGRLRLVQRCQQRPISHVAAEMGISRACASKWVNRRRRHGELGLHDELGYLPFALSG